MNKKYEIAHLVGITREHEKQFRSAEKILTSKGYIVFAPVFYNIEEYLSFGECPNMLDDMCYEKLLMCDFLVIVTPEHIGKSTTLRIKQAIAMGKKIFILENNELMEYKQ
ncbi:hypothetical protein NSB25_20975 [Acetatifactor muris]|uniref:Nucleoside 2-deoxyribosyltransferase n=1 Tax=Acetatifactor muris TaxID=879566 RepID=A0A2K4ZLZ4_9FIRM|nr:hypothetical protein [Acetatifactor muris]MCR2049732.1 hypothetical protein [Acetatifactor muris]SOY31465.1 hypothetical protein AMURIS_04208 [Acetatifactor muris]